MKRKNPNSIKKKQISKKKAKRDLGWFETEFWCLAICPFLGFNSTSLLMCNRFLSKFRFRFVNHPLQIAPFPNLPYENARFQAKRGTVTKTSWFSHLGSLRKLSLRADVELIWDGCLPESLQHLRLITCDYRSKLKPAINIVVDLLPIGLRSLYVKCTKLSIVGFFASLPHLTLLNVHAKTHSCLISQLHCATQLVNLTLHLFNEPNFDCVTFPPSLQYLTLYDRIYQNATRHCSSLNLLPTSLFELKLHINCNIETQLSRLSSLKVLYCPASYGLLSQLPPSLQELDISNMSTQYQLPSLAHLTNLKKLRCTFKEQDFPSENEKTNFSQAVALPESLWSLSTTWNYVTLFNLMHIRLLEATSSWGIVTCLRSPYDKLCQLAPQLRRIRLPRHFNMSFAVFCETFDIHVAKGPGTAVMRGIVYCPRIAKLKFYCRGGTTHIANMDLKSNRLAFGQCETCIAAICIYCLQKNTRYKTCSACRHTEIMNKSHEARRKELQ